MFYFWIDNCHSTSKCWLWLLVYFYMKSVWYLLPDTCNYWKHKICEHSHGCIHHVYVCFDTKCRWSYKVVSHFLQIVFYVLLTHFSNIFDNSWKNVTAFFRRNFSGCFLLLVRVVIFITSPKKDMTLKLKAARHWMDL